MTKISDESYKVKAAIFKALAHPTRLFILDELNKNEKCVCELTDLIGADTSTVSKHLSVLREAGLVTNEKRGNQVYYFSMCSCLNEFISCVENVYKNNIKDKLSKL